MLGSLSCLMQLSWVWSSSEENFLVEVTFPGSQHAFWLQSLNTLLDGSINRGLVCAPMHSIPQTQTILTCPRRANVSNKNTPSMHHPQRQNMTTSMVGHNGEPQRYSWGTQKKKNQRDRTYSKHLGVPENILKNNITQGQTETAQSTCTVPQF